MDFLDPHKRRSHTIRLFIGYALVAITLLIGTGFLTLYVNGFDFNRKTGAIIQNGLVFVDSHPETGDIYLNGESKGKTSNRLVIQEGQYKLEIKRDGYRTWQNDFKLDGSQIQRFVYPVMFPTKLVTKDVQLYSSAPGLTTQSPDKRWLLVQQPASLSNFEVYDLNSTSNTQTLISLPTAILNAASGTHTFELSEWSSDNRHVLLKHNFTGGSEYILVDRETPASSQNLTTYFAQPTSRITLKDKKYDQYYLHDSITQMLSTADLKSKLVTAYVAEVLSFKPFGADTIVYATETGATSGKAVVRLRTGQETYTLREVAKSDTYLVDIARFNNHWYLAAGSTGEGKVYVFRDPIDLIKRLPNKLPAPVAALKQDSPRFISFSSNSRFLEVQSGGSFAVYDAENIRLLHFDTKLPLPASYKATWMDGHRLLAVDSGKLKVFDFDGANLQTLNDANADFMPFFDNSYKALFTVSPSVTVPSRTALTRTELKVN